MFEFWHGFVTGVIATLAAEFVISLFFIIFAVKGAKKNDRQ